MGAAFDLAIEAGLEQLGLTDRPAGSSAARQSYEVHAQLLREWGSAINLTAIRAPEEVARRHVVDSLSAAIPVADRVGAAESLLDLGSGAGYPGLPLAAAVGPRRVGLLDSVGKKVRFLTVAAAAVTAALRSTTADPPSVVPIAERAEDLAQDPEQRAGWQVVTARAVGPLAEVVELALPLLREGGTLIAWKHESDGSGLRDELRDAGSIIRATGGAHLEVVPVEIPLLPGHRLVLIPKARPTPAEFPRPVARRPHRRR